MSVPVYIITLASATQRRAFQEVQAQHLGFNPIWHPAMGVNDFSDDIFLQHAFSWQRPLKKTEVACFMSHLQIWRNIAAGTTPAVVLEDDVILGGNWLESIQTLASHAQADFICLEAWGKKVLGVEQTVDHLKLQSLCLNSAGAAAYMLWPAGAQRLLLQYERYGVALADAFINQVDGWSAWQLVPANVVQMNVAPLYGILPPTHSDSLIAREKYPSAVPPAIGIIFIMKWRRFKGELNKALRRVSMFWCTKRGYVPYLDYDHQ